ncbi:DNA-processing protein DprA [Xanthomonas euvesicatoria]|uniref:DNA-processing protein DprA n=1 Tax=Xanthomonas euvesicatoria TaxID=456327 RepID=UPI001C4671EB|nr:DNA-processing protein DprA [Xanthomonas euvesicatoria]
MIRISPRTQVLLQLSMLPGVGPVTLRKIVALGLKDDFSIDAIARASAPISKALADEKSWSRALELTDQQLDALEEHAARLLSVFDPDYPALLEQSKDDPALLYVKGNLADPKQRSVAIIGTREPTEHGEIIAKRFTEFFSKNGWSVVSGLALGCDAIAHQSAVLAGGHTIAVLAHGLQTIAPTKHKRLAEEILDAGGALVTQYPFGRGAIPQQFVQRDKTQAAMAEGVVMIQSGLKGGSLHASRASVSNKRWLAVPFPTVKDIDADQPKIRANLMLAEGSDEEKLALLQQEDRQALGRIIVLRSKEDYSKFETLDSSCVPVKESSSSNDMFE